MQKFIGRVKELKDLEKEYKRDSGFVVIYGRRRVGKTTLIKEFIKDKNAVYFLATEEAEVQGKRRLLNIIADFIEQPYLKSASFENWEDIFRLLTKYKPNEKKVLVIDEFQYLIQVNSAFTSIFQSIWDEILNNNNIMVILCGSLISMMTTHVLSYESPLYGRRTSQIRLKPLKFTELRNHITQRTFEELVELYSVTGGVPKYFEFFHNQDSLIENIKENILNRSGFLYEEPLFLLGKEVREPLNYFSIIKTISEGKHKLSEISSSLEQKSNFLSPYLKTLIDLDLVEKRVPITESSPEKSRKGLYYISDNFINFWFKYVYPYKGELEFGNQEPVIERLKNNFKDNFVSFIYEDICRDIFLNLCAQKRIYFIPSKIGAYWNMNNTIEIDVVAVDNTNKKIFLAECKYFENKKVDISVYSALLEKSKASDFKGYDIVYGLFSKSGFDNRLIEIASTNQNLILVNEDNILNM